MVSIVAGIFILRNGSMRQINIEVTNSNLTSDNRASTSNNTVSIDVSSNKDTQKSETKKIKTETKAETKEIEEDTKEPSNNDLKPKKKNKTKNKQNTKDTTNNTPNIKDTNNKQSTNTLNTKDTTNNTPNTKDTESKSSTKKVALSTPSVKLDKQISDDIRLGQHGVSINQTCSQKQYDIKNENIENGNKVIYGKKSRFIFRDPLPFVTVTEGKKTLTRQMTAHDIMNSLCRIDELYSKLCETFPMFNCGQYNSLKWLNIFLIGNGSDKANVVSSAAALANNSHMYWNPPVLLSPSMLPIGCHELGHVLTQPLTGHNIEWGAGLNESVADFISSWVFNGESRAYTTINHFYGPDRFRHLNPYSFEALDYKSTEIRAYNSSFWVFYEHRFGLDAFIKILPSFRDAKKSFWEVVAAFNKVDVKIIALQWLEDLLTVAFFRKDPFRVAMAKRHLVPKVLHSDTMMWNSFDNSKCKKIIDNKTLTLLYDHQKLEAFGFAVYNLHPLCYNDLKLQAGNSITINVTSEPSKNDDTSSWVMILVTGATDIELIQASTFTIKSIPNQAPFFVGVMHTRASMMNVNKSNNSGIYHKLSISN